MQRRLLALLALSSFLGLAACEGDDGAQGPAGPAGADGTDGTAGTDGADGSNSLVAQTAISKGAECGDFNGVRVDSGLDANSDGVLGADEISESEYVCGGDYDPLLTGVARRPLSAMMAVTLAPGSGFDSIPEYVKDLVDRYADGETVLGGNFPLGVPSRDDDFSAVLSGLNQNLVVSWFDAITPDTSADAPRYGANNDYIAYFGDGWDSDWVGDAVGSAPGFTGSSDAAWLWSNHEYISNNEPQPAAAPSGQYETLATFLSDAGVLGIADPTDDASWTQTEVDTNIEWEKKQHGGSWLRVERRENGEWKLVPHPNARRYDSSDSTLLRMTGYTLGEPDTDDSGGALPDGVVVGITADCSGGQSPWGTIWSAEENSQSQWGDLENAWVSSRQFILDSPTYGSGANINPDFSASADSEFGRHSDDNTKHNRDVYGFLVEMDPGRPAADHYESEAAGGDGLGHRKLGAMGRARWENVTFVTGDDFALVPNEPVVLYAANDRRAGRVYKFVSNGNYTAGMTRGEIRALLDSGTLFVGHWDDLDALTGMTQYDPTDPNWADCSGTNIDSTQGADAETVKANCPAFSAANPGTGVWIELSTSSTDIAPNAPANGAGTTVGAALQDVDWNGVGGFPDDNAVLSSLFTAAAKIGVRELNRPEDVEWNPVVTAGNPEPSLYVAFTYHGRTIGMKQDGTLVLRNTNAEAVDAAGNVLDPGEPLAARGVPDLHAFVRADNYGSIFRVVEDDPANPDTSAGFTFYPVFFGSQGTDATDTARPDNLSIDSDGGVWFGTDGNTSGSTNASADGIHYLDLDPANAEGQAGIVNPTFGKAFRILHSANDAEATGPAWNANMDTIFYNAQHPGEGRDSSWPSSQPEIH